MTAENNSRLSWLAFVFNRQGRVAEALGAFERADETERRVSGCGLYGGSGIVWTDLLLRLGRRGQARQSAAQHLEISDQHGWEAISAGCRWLLGRLDTLDGDVEAAAAHLREAEATFRGGHVLIDLSGVLLAQADLSRRQRVYHADALVLRGRISLDQGQDTGDDDPVWAWRALDDAESALALAQRSGYAWAEREARTNDRRQSLPQPFRPSVSGRQMRLSGIVGVRDRSVAQGKDPYERAALFDDVEDPIRAHAQ